MISKLRLENWKSHPELELEFKTGANVILGQMGSGKSSILQALSYGLFGTFSELKSRDVKLADLLTRGSGKNTADVSIDFDSFSIRRVVNPAKASEATIRNKEGKLLAGPNPTQVNDFLKSHLKVDEDLFLKTIYAKQNEIDVFLQLNPQERKKKIDSIMGIDKFENARAGCVTLINAIKQEMATKQETLMSFDLSVLAKQIESLNSDISRFKSEAQQIVIELNEVRLKKSEQSSGMEELRQKYDSQRRLEEKEKILVQRLEELKVKLKSLPVDADVSSMMPRLQEIKFIISELQKERQQSLNDYEDLQAKLNEYERKSGMLEQLNEELRKELTKIDNCRRQLEELEHGGSYDILSRKIKQIEDEIESANTKRQAAISEIKLLEKSVNDLRFTATGKCPTCSADLNEEKRRALVVERKERMAILQQNAEHHAEDVEKLKLEKKSIEQNIDSFKEIIIKLRPEMELRERERQVAISISEINGKRSATLENLEQLKLKLVRIEREYSEKDEEYKKLSEFKEVFELQKEQTRANEELEKINILLKEKIDPEYISMAEKEYQELIRREQELKTESESKALLINEKITRLSDLENKQNQLSTLQKDIDCLSSKLEYLNKFRSALMASQEQLRVELISAVNEIMSTIWLSLYPYKTWPSIKLRATESDYVLELMHSDSNWLSVISFASGGERMLACLALRIAFAKIMAPNLSLLILDEPTHNLDQNAISTLIEVIQEKLPQFIDQVFIVTHEETLAEAGQNIIRLK